MKRQATTASAHASAKKPPAAQTSRVSRPPVSAAAPTKSGVAKVSHTLDVELAERLEEFAFRQRFSESAVIEYALRRFFDEGDDQVLGGMLRDAGAGRRRKT